MAVHPEHLKCTFYFVFLIFWQDLESKSLNSERQMQCRWGTILMQAFFMLPVKKGNADCVLGALLFSPMVIPSSSVTLNATHISLRLPILCLQLKVAFRLVFQTAFLIALHRSPIDRLSINSWFISGMINSSWFPRTLLVLTLKVLHFRKPLSPRQNEDAWSSCL